MDFVYAIASLAALIEWLLAAALYATGWYHTRYDLNRFADSLSAAGVVTAAGGALWLAWEASLSPALARNFLATGLAISALVIYAALARRRPERLSGAAVLGFAVLVQLFTVGQLLWLETEGSLPVAFLPLWTALYTLAGLVGYGGLAVSALMILLSFALTRISERLSEDQWKAIRGLSVLEWQSWQIALVALSLSLAIGLMRSWWGLGQVIVGELPWALITWLLLAAGGYALTQGATRRRPARALLVLACGVGILSVLTMAGPLMGTG